VLGVAAAVYSLLARRTAHRSSCSPRPHWLQWKPRASASWCPAPRRVRHPPRRRHPAGARARRNHRGSLFRRAVSRRLPDQPLDLRAAFNSKVAARSWPRPSRREFLLEPRTTGTDGRRHPARHKPTTAVRAPRGARWLDQRKLRLPSCIPPLDLRAAFNSKVAVRSWPRPSRREFPFEPRTTGTDGRRHPARREPTTAVRVPKRSAFAGSTQTPEPESHPPLDLRAAFNSKVTAPSWPRPSRREFPLEPRTTGTDGRRHPARREPTTAVRVPKRSALAGSTQPPEPVDGGSTVATLANRTRRREFRSRTGVSRTSRTRRRLFPLFSTTFDFRTSACWRGRWDRSIFCSL
jgi:hypothetical protein